MLIFFPLVNIIEFRPICMTVGVIPVFHFLSMDSVGKWFTIIRLSPGSH